MSSAADPTTATATDQQLQAAHGWPPAACDVEDLWSAWRDACDDLRLAHEAWRDSVADDRREAYAVVVAAADREAVAAETLSRITARV
jgi:hypothetical protein